MTNSFIRIHILVLKLHDMTEIWRLKANSVESSNISPVFEHFNLYYIFYYFE